MITKILILSKNLFQKKVKLRQGELAIYQLKNKKIYLMQLSVPDIWLFSPTQENNMQIILLETHNKLGKAGEIVSVKDGFARNYLIPQKKALVANKENKADLESKMSQINKNNEIKINEAKLIRDKIDGKDLSIQMEANEDGNLYGNISQKLILNEISEQLSVSLDADNVVLGQIKSLGDHKMTIRLYDNISAQLNLKVKKKD